MVAMESRKQAAKRPRPPFPRPASGSSCKQGEQINFFSFRCLCDKRFKQQVGHIVGRRAAKEKLHGQVVDALGILALVCFLREDPSLRENISHGPSKGFVTLPAADRRKIFYVVEEQMPFVQPVRSHQRNGAASVLFEKFCPIGLVPFVID